MYGVTHMFNGFFMLGFVGRFIIAIILLSFLYSKDKSNRMLKKGITILITAGVCIFAIMIFFTVIFLTFGGMGAVFGSLMGGFSRFFY